MEARIMNGLLFSGAVLGLISVIFGAAGDHFLTLSSEQAESLDTAIRYNMLYAVLITGIALIRIADIPTSLSKRLWITGVIFAVGTVLFSFGIYISIITGLSALTYLTPIGGLTIMAGWGYLMRVAFQSISSPKPSSPES
jgi:uncharacterized membrane protein YgdD (TMEM256/DUF423 family)